MRLFSLLILGLFSVIITAQAAVLKPEYRYVRLHTSKGEIDLELYYHRAPEHVNTFIQLVETGYYNGIPWHYVIPGKLAQTGDGLRYNRGFASMEMLNHENTGLSNTANAVGFDRLWIRGYHVLTPQFYLLPESKHGMDKDHPNVFGKIHRGSDIAKNLRKGDMLNRAELLRSRPKSATPPLWDDMP